MSNPNLHDIFTDVANAIREKTGSTNLMHPVDFADEIATIHAGGDQPQLHAPTISLGSQSYVADILNLSNPSTNGDFAEYYDIYANNIFKGSTAISNTFDLRTVINVVGTYVVTVKCRGTNMADSDASNSVNYTYYEYANVTRTLINCSLDNTSDVVLKNQPYTANVAVAIGYSIVGAAVSIIMNGVDVTASAYDNGAISIASVTGDLSISVDCETLAAAYVIGFSGMSKQTPALTRTDEAVNATFSITDGIIDVTGIDMSYVWGGYIGNDGEALTWDSTTRKYMYNGNEYTGNVFSKINRFFIKPSYVDGVLDGYQLCYSAAKPDATWEDWFYGKEYVGIGCYKAVASATVTAMQSVAGLKSNGEFSPNTILESYKLVTTTNGNLHEKWFNENAILQVLFMVIFATRRFEDVFPATAIRSYSSTAYPTGYMDYMRASSTIATCYSTMLPTYYNGNMFLGIEDFVGFGLDVVAGVIFKNMTFYASMDYATFAYSNDYPAANVTLNAFTNDEYIKSLQEDVAMPGLLVPKRNFLASSQPYKFYFCDACRFSNYSGYVYAWCQGALYESNIQNGGLFYARYDFSASEKSSLIRGRLCRTPD